MSQAAPAPPASRAAFPRELSHLLLELAISLQKYSVYPQGHPYLERCAEGVVRRLNGLLLDAPSLTLGVARDQLLIDNVATDRRNPVLAGLAGRLHRHRLAGVTLDRGLEPDEADRLLAILASDPDANGVSDVVERAAGLRGVKLHPVSYEDLQMAGGDTDAAVTTGIPRASQLWLGLARTVVGGEGDLEVDAEAVAQVLNHGTDRSYDQVVVGYMSQLAEELRSGDGPGAAEVRRRLSDALARLSPEALQRLLEMGGDAAQRRRFVLDASHGFSADAVVRLVEAASGASRQPMSQSMVRLLSKLAAHAEEGDASARTAADIALRSQVESLVDGWSGPDPNPPAYTATLDALAHLELSPAEPRRASLQAEAERIVQMCLEVDAVGPSLEDAVDRLLADGVVATLIGLLEDAPANAAAAAGWDLLARPAAIRALLQAGAEGSATLDRVLARVGPAAIGALVDEMLEAESRVVRRGALARLVALGAPAATEAVARLNDPRWFVVRNLLALIGEVGPPADFAVAPFLRHDDHRVRREAFKIALPIAEERPRAVPLALADPSPQIQLMGLTACMHGCPPAAVPLVSARAADPRCDPELRLVAIRALGTVQDPTALRTLLHLVDGGRSFLRARRLAHSTPAMLNALAALATGWSGHPEAVPLLNLGMRSTDPHIVAAAVARREAP